MSLFGIKSSISDASGLVAFKNYVTEQYLSVDQSGKVSTIKLTGTVGNDETLALVNVNIKEPEDNQFYIRSNYGDFLTFNLYNNKLCTQKISHSMTPWRKHTSHLYARFSSDDLFFFTPSSTEGIVGASLGISIYGNNYLSSNANVSNKMIPGKHEMWILCYIKQNASIASPPKPKLNPKPKGIAFLKSTFNKNTEQQSEVKVEPDTDEHKCAPFDEQLNVISNLVSSNNEALAIYKQQIENKTIAVNNMNEWNKLYKRLYSKHQQWNTHKMSLTKMGNKDVVKALDHKYGDKWTELEETKQNIVRENNTINKLRQAKEQTSEIMAKSNDVIKEFDDEIARLEKMVNALKQKRLKHWNELNDQIMPKLNTQSKCIDERMNGMKVLNIKKTDLERELTSIQETKHQIHKFENDIIYIMAFLESKFTSDLQKHWRQWSTNDVVIWLGFLNCVYAENNEYQFQKEENKHLLLQGVTSSNMEGKDLKNINDLILRSWDIKEKEDRELILKTLNELMNDMEPSADNDTKQDELDANEEEQQDRQCVVCMDATANMMFMPCNHIALCQSCYAANTFEKCAFCGNPCDKVIKCYHVGF